MKIIVKLLQIGFTNSMKNSRVVFAIHEITGSRLKINLKHDWIILREDIAVLSFTGYVFLAGVGIDQRYNCFLRICIQ